MTMTKSFGEVQRGVFPAMLRATFADPTTQPFWDATKEERLVAPRCTNCGTFRFPPYHICYNCRSEGVEWVELPGTGTVYSYTVIHHPLHPELAAVVPYISAIIELDGTQGAGARLLANIIEWDPDEITIGSRVQAAFDHVNDELTLVRFRPLREEPSRQ